MPNIIPDSGRRGFSNDLTALATIGLRDGSGLVRATADYYVSRSWTVGALVSGTFGGRQSDFGSLPQLATALIRVVRYLWGAPCVHGPRVS